VLTEFGERLSAPERARLTESIRRAVEGELHQRRLRPSYTNIALMHGFLWADAGRRLGRADWVREAEAWVEAVYAAFKPHESFDEYNSPTYYGVDLYGLALLRRHGATARLRELGGTMEAALWRDIAQFYHAGLRNLCGPYDRAYGMDMQRYVSLVGVWLALEWPAAIAPFPPIEEKMEHGHDFLCTPCYVLLGTKIPDDVRPHFEKFLGERTLTRPIADGKRVATAWLAPDLMIGAESTGQTKEVTGPSAQFRPATIHWRAPGGETAWIALVRAPMIDARAAQNRLTVSAAGDCVFRIACPGADAARVTRDRWDLPGLSVAIESDAHGCTVEPGDGFIDVTYRGGRTMLLTTRRP
jgi:hypothetical protein